MSEIVRLDHRDPRGRDMSRIENDQFFGWRDVPLRGSQVIPPVNWPKGYEPPSARPVPLTDEVVNPEAKAVSDKLMESLHRSRLQLTEKVEAQLREIEEAGLLDQVDRVEYSTDLNKGDPWSAVMTARILMKGALPDG